MNAAVHFLISFWVKHRVSRVRDRGATAAEYALLASLIAVAIFGSVMLFGQLVSGLFVTTTDAMPG